MKDTLYFAAFIKAPFEDGRGGIECPRVSYSRLPVSVVGGRETISWPRAKGPWGKIVAVGVYDAPVNGNLLIWYPLADPQMIDRGDALTLTRKSVSGVTLTLPSRSVLVLDSGEVWVAKGDSRTRRRVHTFVSLSSLVEQAKKKKHTVLTNYSHENRIHRRST